jgi:hypothetical protein
MSIYSQKLSEFRATFTTWRNQKMTYLDVGSYDEWLTK